ncbi:hypothetical protein [Pseudosporangium ferrugineum]|uniref:Uncharacterized protein n=1 Tax=Pseudosporangium ferrugineum TaxID=439699 RepID=A0A2T0RXF9_9ACTN|nr:hypothetical protein [Pseudosporangium ferrugineum]PRY25861.1 hypothetical protein CLV70_112227 [Pseudosporangium ferrugineum]
MAGELVTAITSLGGVVLGGGLSFLVQNNTQRMSARIEQRKQDLARAESRRAEQLTHLERFIAVAAEAERVAFGRPGDFVPGDAWSASAQEVMQRLWVAERMLQVLYPSGVHTAARAYFERINGAVWEGVPQIESLYAELDVLRGAFLAASRAAIG